MSYHRPSRKWCEDCHRPHKTERRMKTLKSIDVTVTYSVCLKDIQVPDEVYNDIIALYQMDVFRISPDTMDDMEGEVYDWLRDNIQERDWCSISYEIEDIETEEQ